MNAIRRRRRPADDPQDYGAQPWRTDVEDAPDPDRPNATIRRGRRRDPLRHMLREGMEPALFIAAERFRDMYALAEGAREGVGSVRLEPWQRCHYAARVADARQEVRESFVAVGMRLAGAFNLAVVSPLMEKDDPEPMTVRRIERILRVRNGSGADLIREALERLRDWQTEAGG